MDELKIFVSGTQDDLQPERKAAADAIHALGHEPIMAETYGAQPMPSISVIREMIDFSDIYVGIYGALYGSYKMEGGTSVTEFEFTEFHHKHPDRILIYVKETKPEAGQELFLKRVQDFDKGYFRRPKFKNPQQLADWIKEDLAQFIVRVVREKLRGTPEPTLIRTYLEEVVKPKSHRLADQMYIDRTVTKADALFLLDFTRSSPRTTKKKKLESLMDVLAREKKLVLLGEPGMGKTTSLRHLTMEAARQGNEIPIFMELKYYRGGELEALLAHHVNDVLLARNLALARDLTESTQILKKWLAQSDSRFLLLIDGLNEVSSEYHTSVRGALDALLNYPQHIVLACREREYDGSLNDRAQAFVLQGLQENEIRNYLENTLGTKGIKLFNEQFHRDKKLLTFAANPFMLYLIGEVARRDRQVRLPKNRGKLIQEFVALMPKLRISEGTHSKLAFDIVETALACLSFGMQEHEQQRADLREVRTWNIPTEKKDLDDVLAQAKDWRLLESDGKLGESIEFLHQLFLEYFVAAHFNNEFQKYQNWEDVFGDLQLSDWWESIEMLAGICDSPVEFIQFIALSSIRNDDPLAAILAHYCWRSSDDVFKGKARDNVVDALVNALCHPLSHMFLLDTLICLSETRDTRLIPLMISLMRFEDGNIINEIIGRSLMWMGKPAVEPLIVALESRSVRIRGFSIHVLGRLRDKRAIKPLVKGLHDPKSKNRLKAVIALGRIGGTQAIKPLLDVIGDQDATVRNYATFALITIGKSAVLPLRGLLRHSNVNVRMNTAFALRKIGSRIDTRALKLAIRKEKLKDLDFFLDFSAGMQMRQKADNMLRKIARRLPSRSGMPFWGDNLSSFSWLDRKVREANGKTPWNMKLANAMREEAEKIRNPINL